MNLIQSKDKIAEVIDRDSFILPFINRFGVRFNFGDKTIEEICRGYDIDHDFFLAMLNTYLNEQYMPDLTRKRFRLDDIIAFLQQAHNYFREVYVVGVEAMLQSIFSHCKDQCKSHDMIRVFFNDYKKELFVHLQQEEDTTFPYILSLEKADLSEAGFQQHAKQYSNYSMDRFRDEHDDVETKISDLKSLIIRYLSCDFSEREMHTLIFELSRFDKDLRNHTQVEEKIMVPLVRDLEKQIKRKYGKK